MSLIDSTYFINDINLTSNQINNIQQWIDANEEDILVLLLGRALYDELIADLDEGGDPQTEKFTKLVDGENFTFTTMGGYEVTKKWIGLRNTAKKSLIADYIYCVYRNETEGFNTDGGQKRGTAENAETVSLVPKLVRVWNKMVDRYGNIPKNQRNADYFLNKDNYEHYDSEPSAYNYLLAKTTDFPNWVFTPIGKLNIFNL